MPPVFRRKRRFARVKRRKANRKLATIGKVKRLIKGQQEMKYWQASGQTTASYSGTVTHLTAIPQGDSDTSRDGDQAIPTSMELRMNVVAADTTNIMRVIVFRYNDMLSGDPAASAVLQTTASFEGVLSPYYHDGRQSFTVVFDRTLTLTATYKPIMSIVKHIKLAKKPIKYQAGSSTAGANRYWLLVISDSSAVTHPSYSYYTRINFTDS